MKLFTFYKRRIQNRINELFHEREKLINERDRLGFKQTLSPKEWASYSVKIGDINKRINELTGLLINRL